MTNEANDKRVFDAYRDLASEKTSAELDHKVLAMAAAEARGARGFPRTWFRPLAWAATIALSFAFVLELSQVDDVPTRHMDADLAETIEESPRPVDAAAKQKDEAPLRRDLSKRLSDEPASMKATITPAQSALQQADAAENAALNQPAAESPSLESPSVAPDFELDLGMDNMSMLREAEEQARARSGPAQAVATLIESKEQAHSCDAEARASAANWYECVRNLRDTGQMEPAKRELDALLAEFPDFREPLEDGQEQRQTDR